MILADKRGINGPLDAQLLLHRLGVTVQVGVGLPNFVKKHLVVLTEEQRLCFSHGEETMTGST